METNVTVMADVNSDMNIGPRSNMLKSTGQDIANASGDQAHGMFSEILSRKMDTFRNKGESESNTQGQVSGEKDKSETSASLNSHLQSSENPEKTSENENENEIEVSGSAIIMDQKAALCAVPQNIADIVKEDSGNTPPTVGGQILEENGIHFQTESQVKQEAGLHSEPSGNQRDVILPGYADSDKLPEKTVTATLQDMDRKTIHSQAALLSEKNEQARSNAPGNQRDGILPGYTDSEKPSEKPDSATKPIEDLLADHKVNNPDKSGETTAKTTSIHHPEGNGYLKATSSFLDEMKSNVEKNPSLLAEEQTDLTGKTKTELKAHSFTGEKTPEGHLINSGNIVNMNSTKTTSGENLPAQIINRVAAEFRENLSGDGGRIKITLAPPSLGSLEMDVIVKNSTVKVLLVAESKDVQQMLSGNLDSLKGALQHQGLTIDRCEVMMQNRQEHNPQGFGQQQPFNHETFGDSMSVENQIYPEGATSVVHRQMNESVSRSGNISLFV